MSAPKRNTAMRRRLVSAWISTVLSLALVLLLVGMGTLLLVNARAVSNYFKENMQVSVLLKQQVNEEQAVQYENEVAALPGVRSTHFVSREQGVEEMSRLLGQDFLDVFESAPVPISIDVNLEADYVSTDSLEVMKTVLGKSPLVEEVVYQTSLVDALNQNLSKISLGLAILVALLLFISFVAPRLWAGPPCRGCLPPWWPSCCWWAACSSSGTNSPSFSRYSNSNPCCSPWA